MTVTAVTTAQPVARAEPFLRLAMLAVMLIPLGVSVVVESPVPLGTRMEAALLWLLCVVPGWSYLGTSQATRRPVPFIPMIGLLYGLYYALAPALGTYNQHYRIVLSPRRDYDEAVFVALMGWLTLAVGYGTAKLLIGRSRTATVIDVPDSTRKRYGAVLMSVALVLEGIRLVHTIPAEIGGILRFITTLGWFGTGILISMDVKRQLSLPYRLLAYSGVFGFLFMAISGGTVAAAVFYGAVVILSAWIGMGRLKLSWIIGGLLGVATIIALRGVSEQYRKITWYEGEGGGLVSRTRLFFTLLEERVQLSGIDGAVQMGFETSAGRSANLDVLGDVIIRTPGEIPYWGGETYLSLVGAFVPRIAWPNKPTKELGQAFGHRYSYLDAHDAGTSINLPILVEFYINFGLAGVMFGMTLVGFIYYVLEHIINNAGQDLLLSLIGVVILVPMANIESDFSLGFGGLLLNGTALWVVLRTIRRSAAARRGSQTGAPQRLEIIANQRSG